MNNRLKSVLLAGMSFVVWQATAHAKDQKPLDVAGVDGWQAISYASISEDEKWTAQFVRPSSTLAELLGKDREAAMKLYPELEKTKDRLFCAMVKSANAAKVHEICGSGDVTEAKFSQSNVYFGVLRAKVDDKPKSDAKPGEDEDKAGPSKELVLLNLATGIQTVYQNVESFEFGGDQVFVLTGGESGELLAVSLVTQKSTPFGTAQSYALNRQRTQIAWIKSVKDGVGNGVYVSSTANLATSQLDSGQTNYASLEWALSGDALVVSRRPFAIKPEANASEDKKQTAAKPEKTEPKAGTAQKMELDVSVFAAWDIGTAEIKSMVISSQTPGFIAGKVIAEDSARWSDDRSAILLSLTDRRTEAQKKRLASGGGEERDEISETSGMSKPDLAMWHWSQAEIPDQSNQSNEQPEIRSYPSIYWQSTGKLVPLLTEADSELMQVKDFSKEGITANKKHLIATQGLSPLEKILVPHLEDAPLDVFLVDLKTGIKQPILKQITAVNAELSPNGRYVTYYQSNHHHIYKIDGGTSYNLTEKTGRNFSSDADDNFDGLPAAPARWTKSGGLLLEDTSDVWFVANPDSGQSEPSNLSVVGLEQGIDFSVLFVEKIDSLSKVNSNLPIFANTRLADDRPLLHAFDKRGLRFGYAQVSNTGSGSTWVRPLAEKSLQGGSYYNALQSFETAAGTRLVFQEQDMAGRSIYMAGPGMENPKTIFTDNWNSTPLRREYAKPGGVRVLRYKCTWGKELTGALLLPHNYRSGTKYPMITIMYEWGYGGTAIGSRDYFEPSVDGSNANDLASQGYAVLLADVAFEPKNPGVSSTQCLMSAVDAAVATGVVDEKHMGVHGHSWGGYQTLFSTTQTNRFAAAIAGAGLTDLISMWGGVYWGGSIAQHTLIEKGQGRMIDSIWNNWDGYLQNSPLYHARNLQTPMLMLHNDKDGAVGFYQAHEYFLALRRLRKPAVLLQYRGEDHGLSKRANLIDYRQRSLEFWNHYLKDAAAPAWWSAGVKPYDMEEHIKTRFPASETDESDEGEDTE